MPLLFANPKDKVSRIEAHMILVIIFNPVMPYGISRHYRLDKSISNLRVVG